MTRSIFDLLDLAWRAVSNWVNILFSSTGMEIYIIGVIVAMLAIRNIMYPMMKAGVASERVYSSTIRQREAKRQREASKKKGKK